MLQVQELVHEKRDRIAMARRRIADLSRRIDEKGLSSELIDQLDKAYEEYDRARLERSKEIMK